MIGCATTPSGFMYISGINVFFKLFIRIAQTIFGVRGYQKVFDALADELSHGWSDGNERFVAPEYDLLQVGVLDRRQLPGSERGD